MVTDQTDQLEITRALGVVETEIRETHFCTPCDKGFTTKTGETLHIRGAKHQNRVAEVTGVEQEPGEPVELGEFAKGPEPVVGPVVGPVVEVVATADPTPEVVVEAHLETVGAPRPLLPQPYYVALPADPTVQMVYGLVLDQIRTANALIDEGTKGKLSGMNQAKEIFAARHGLVTEEGGKGKVEVEALKPEVLGMALGPVDMVTGTVPLIKRVWKKGGSKINGGKLTAELLTAGLDAEKVAKIVADSTDVGSGYYEWRMQDQEVNGVPLVKDEEIE